MIAFRNRNVVIDKWRLSMDPLLPVVILVMAWALSERYYPGLMYLESSFEYWLLGGFTALFITVSIIIHELGHSFTARRLNIPIERIHLYLFGGMAELQHRPHVARQELWIAVAGPVASLTLAFICWFIYEVILSPEFLPYYFFRFTALINLLIGLFNLLPIFPLDGGRLLRALLWALDGNYIKASARTKAIGSVFIAFLLMLAVADYFFMDSGYALIGGILAMYMFYTFHTGRYELSYSPRADDLIHTVSGDNGTREMVQDIAKHRSRVIHRCIFPVLENTGGIQVIEGRHITTEAFHIDPESVRVAGEGDYIDLDKPETWRSSVKFNAEWVPVYRSDAFLGMCDARELRFWMQQKQGVLELWPGPVRDEVVRP